MAFPIRESDDNKIKSGTTDYITGCCMFMHSSIYKRLNGFDEKYFMYNEDVDFCLRARKLGNKCIFSPKAIVYHAVSNSFRGRVYIKKIIFKVVSTLKVFITHQGLLLGIIIFTQFLIRNTWDYFIGKKSTQ